MGIARRISTGVGDWDLVKRVEFTLEFDKPGNNIIIIDGTPIPIDSTVLITAWELIKKQFEKEAEHQREQEKKELDNKDAKKWLEIAKDKEVEQSIEIDPPHGTKIKYQRGGGKKKKGSSKKKKDDDDSDRDDD